MLLDVTTVIYNLRVPLHAINARQVKNGNCIVNITVSAESVEHLKNIISRLEKIHGVFSVDRMTQ
jgi:GTP pyrophosphokinase